MRRIHQLFSAASQQLVRQATIARGRRTLCWYPSAGTDFRHVRMLEQEGLSDPGSPPLVYLHTNIRRPEDWDALAGAGMKISEISEIYPKVATREVCREVCSERPDAHIGKVFLLDVEMEATCRGRLIRLPIPILYFVTENLAFLVGVLLHYRLRLDTLVHIKDGGGTMGGSWIPNNFIYQTAPVLKLRRVVCDEAPENKSFNTGVDFGVLMREWRHAAVCGKDRSSFGGKDLQETSEADLRGTWEGRRIDPYRLAPSATSRPPEGNIYYDWRRKTKGAGSSDTSAILSA